MNVATAVPQLDADFFNERGLPKVYNLPPAYQIGSHEHSEDNSPK